MSIGRFEIRQDDHILETIRDYNGSSLERAQVRNRDIAWHSGIPTRLYRVATGGEGYLIEVATRGVNCVEVA